MNRLVGIGVHLETAAQSTDNALPILHEVRHALSQLLASGEETSIDLRSIPLSPDDRENLFRTLGSGEVEIQLNTLGKSTVRETGVAGVWLIDHFNADGQPLAQFLEITTLPTIVKSQPDDIRESLARLTERLQQT